MSKNPERQFERIGVCSTDDQYNVAQHDEGVTVLRPRPVSNRSQQQHLDLKESPLSKLYISE